MKSSRSIEILCLVLTALVLVWSKTWSAQFWPSLGLVGVFAVAIVLFHSSSRLLPRRPRAKLQIEAWSMVIFITGALWVTGKSASPLMNLYLLPIILSALTLGRAVTLTQVGVIAAVNFALAASTPGMHAFGLAYASRAIGELAPVLLVAYLTTTLSADITEARQQIESLAQRDPLTGLFNSRMFNAVWDREHAACGKKDGVYALLMIDIDGLQAINASFGREGGNSAIVLVAQCLERSIRGTDTSGRLGGDEFALLLPGASPEIADAVSKRVRHNVYKTTLDLRSRMIRCSVSIGMVNYPKDGRDLRELMRLAERNMYRDKELRHAPAQAKG